MYLIIRMSKTSGVPESAIVHNTRKAAQKELLERPNPVFCWDGKETSPVEDDFWDPLERPTLYKS